MPNQYTYTDPVARFWSRVDRSSGPSGCWPRAGSHFQTGYVEFHYHGLRVGGHCFAYTSTFGERPPDKPFILHKCPGGGNRWCVNPAHLVPGTQRENAADAAAADRLSRGLRNGAYTHPEQRPRGDRHGTQTHPEAIARGERAGAARLTEMDVRAIRQAHAAGAMIKTLAAQYSVGTSTIGHIVRRETWRHVV